jgi:hypothetical protein
MVRVCLWQRFRLPLVELMLTITLRFVWALFTTIWDVIGYQGLGSCLGTQLQRRGLLRWLILGTIVLFVLLLIAVLIIVVLTLALGECPLVD